MEISIQQADIADLDLLVQWRMEVLREVFPQEVYRHPPDLEEQNRRYYLDALPAGEHIACFALVEHEIVGCGGLCLSREMPSPDNPSGRCAYLMNIYCRPFWRKQGVGNAVVTWLVAQAQERKIPKIYLESSDMAFDFYHSLGFCDMPGMLILRGKNAR